MNDTNVTGPGKTGVLIVGAHGMTAIAAIAGSTAMAQGVLPSQFAVTGHPAFDDSPLLKHSDLVFGGWDYSDETLHQTAANYAHISNLAVQSLLDLDFLQFPGLLTALDFPVGPGRTFARHGLGNIEAIDAIRDDIRTFRLHFGCSSVVVVYLGSPSRKPSPIVQDLHDLDSDDVPSSLLYAVGAITEGAHFIDFTPSYTLEYGFLRPLAQSNGVQIAGRDGSTGQTMIKVALAELFAKRGLHIEGWHSANLLGNHDGVVLTTDGYDEPKMADKHDALATEPTVYNRIRIDFAPPWGDRKESWDAIELKTWLGGEASMRINWRGSDSELAGPMVLDLVRLVELGARRGMSGFIPELGFFFKRPYDREASSLSERWAELARVYGNQS